LFSFVVFSCIAYTLFPILFIFLSISVHRLAVQTDADMTETQSVTVLNATHTHSPINHFFRILSHNDIFD